MASLASFIPGLAKILSVKASTLYERQRALTRAGLLTAKPGRGPGSGVEATPESVAMMLISMLAPGGLAQTHVEAKAIARLKSEGKACHLTREKTFKAALVAILADEQLAEYTSALTVDRTGEKFGAEIEIRSLNALAPKQSNFGLPVLSLARSGQLTPMWVSSHLFLPFKTIARLLKEEKK